MARILLIDDDEDMALCLKQDLEKAGFRVECLDSARGGLEVLARGDFDLLLLDNQMPGLSGIDFLRQLRGRNLSVPVILMTGVDTPDTHIQARMLGARAYFVKPVDQLFERLEPLIREMLRVSRLMKERVHLPSADAPPPASSTALLGSSPAMHKVYELVAQVAESDASVLIVGETGAGKEMIARAVFQYSTRSEKPFVAFNCAAIPEQLLESELFGHEKGAFTGAGERPRIGKFEQADGGTLLLDEIGDMSLATQAKILRVLQEGEVVRLGSNEAIKVDVRIIACTHHDLTAAIRRKQFREDLYYRLNTVIIRLPPLRERPEDVPLLARHFLAREGRARGRPGLTFHPGALDKLCRYPWPGNVRELQSVIKLAALLCDGVQVLPENLEIGPVSLAEPERGEPEEADALAAMRAAVRWAWRSGKSQLLPLLGDMLERELLQLALTQGQRPGQLAGRLGMGRTTLWKRLKELGLVPPAAEES